MGLIKNIVAHFDYLYYN